MSSEGHSKGSGHSESNNPATASSLPDSDAAPADNAVGAQSEFIVEKFTGKRFENGKVLMQVKWKGFPSEMSTWEPFENLTNCVVLLGEFEAELFRKQQMAFRSPASPASRCGKKKVGRLPSSTKASPSPANQSMPVLEENDNPMMTPKSNGINRAIASTPRTTAGYKIGGLTSNGTNSPWVSTPKTTAGYKIGGPKSNGRNSPRISTPKSAEGHKIVGNHKKKVAPPSLPVAKNPAKLHPEMHLQLSQSSDDETPSCSFSGRPSSTPAPVLPNSNSLEADLELSDSSTSPRNISSESDSLPLSVLAGLSANKRSPSLNTLKEQARKWQAGKSESKFGTLVKMQKKPSTPVKDVVNEMAAASNSEAPVEKSMKSTNSMQLAEKDPVEQPSVGKKSKKNEKKSLKEGENKKVPEKIEKKSSKEDKKKKVPQKVQQKESGDEDTDSPLTPQTPRTPAGAARGSFFSWKMPPCTTAFGLARGLELDKVVHNFQVRDRLFLFVTWKGLDEVDAVPLEDLKEAYPAKVIQYFENMQRRYK